jgi:hypothetical protein
VKCLDEPETVEWTCLVDAKAHSSETPTWAADHDALFWIDTEAPTLNKTTGEGRTQTWKVPMTVGGCALREGGQAAVVALVDGLYHLDLADGSLRRLIDAPYGSFGVVAALRAMGLVGELDTGGTRAACAGRTGRRRAPSRTHRRGPSQSGV